MKHRSLVEFEQTAIFHDLQLKTFFFLLTQPNLFLRVFVVVFFLTERSIRPWILLGWENTECNIIIIRRRESLSLNMLDFDSFVTDSIGDCNIPGNATLLYDIKFVRLYSGNRSQ